MSEHEVDIYEDEEGIQQYLIFLAADRYFAVPALSVREMLPLQEIVALPEAPVWVRGVINVRNETFTLVDFRKRIGLAGTEEENDQLVEELNRRELEHMHWLDQLEESINDDIPFEGETDPHRCRFGLWYDTYTAPNVAVQLELKKFDEPHKAVHGTAEKALSLKQEGKVEEARALINKHRKGELARMLTLFGSLKQLIRNSAKEVTVLVEDSGLKFSMVVDGVESVETLESEENTALKSFQQEDGKFVHHTRVAKRGESGTIVYIVNPAWIIEGGDYQVPNSPDSFISNSPDSGSIQSRKMNSEER